MSTHISFTLKEQDVNLCRSGDRGECYNCGMISDRPYYQRSNCHHESRSSHLYLVLSDLSGN